MARIGDSLSDELVLMDSGANEVLRSVNGRSKGQTKSSTPLSGTLASGHSAQAYRNRHGEVCLPKNHPTSNGQEESNWIVGLGYQASDRSWWKAYPHPFQAEQIRRERSIDKGLLHLRWDDCKLLKVRQIRAAPQHSGRQQQHSQS